MEQLLQANKEYSNHDHANTPIAKEDSKPNDEYLADELFTKEDKKQKRKKEGSAGKDKHQHRDTRTWRTPPPPSGQERH